MQEDELFPSACGHSAQRQRDTDLRVYAVKLSSHGSLDDCDYICSERTSQSLLFPAEQYRLLMLCSYRQAAVITFAVWELLLFASPQPS